MHSLRQRTEVASVRLGAAQLERVLRRLLADDDEPMTTGKAKEAP